MAHQAQLAANAAAAVAAARARAQERERKDEEWKQKQFDMAGAGDYRQSTQHPQQHQKQWQPYRWPQPKPNPKPKPPPRPSPPPPRPSLPPPRPPPPPPPPPRPQSAQQKLPWAGEKRTLPPQAPRPQQPPTQMTPINLLAAPQHLRQRPREAVPAPQSTREPATSTEAFRAAAVSEAVAKDITSKAWSFFLEAMRGMWRHRCDRPTSAQLAAHATSHATQLTPSTRPAGATTRRRSRCTTRPARESSTA